MMRDVLAILLLLLLDRALLKGLLTPTEQECCRNQRMRGLGRSHTSHINFPTPPERLPVSLYSGAPVR